MIRSALASSAITLGFLLLVLVVVLGPVAFTTPDPMAVIDMFLLGPFRNPRHTGNIIEMATPAMFCGLAVTLMFRAGAFNLGAEGAFFLGGLGTAAAAILLPIPGWLGAPVAVLIGAACGSLVCVVPGVIKATTGASELVCSLMLNYAALFIGLFVLNYYLRDASAGAMVSFKIPSDMRFDRLIEGTRIHIGSVIAIAACIIGAIYLFRTRGGFEARLAGSGNGFAAHLGLGAGAIAIKAQVIGGLIAAGAGGIEILGLYQRFSWQALPGNGWTGVIVAILARNNPILIIPAALFLSYLQVGGDLIARNFSIPSEIVALMQALVMLLVTSLAIIEHPTVRRFVTGRKTAGQPA